MAEPDRTNADAERVSDIVAYRELAERCLEHMGKADFQTVLNDCHAAARALIAAADIIEAQSKALAEARMVKPLEWALRIGTTVYEADTPFGVYIAFVYDDRKEGALSLQSVFNNRACGHGLGAAQAVAQADYAARILSALVTPTPENPNG